MTLQTKILIGILVFLTLAFSFYHTSQPIMSDAIIAQERARIESKYQVDIKDVKAQVTVKEAELKKSERLVATYRKKISVAENKLRMIPRPATASEAKQRLKDLGYEVR